MVISEKILNECSAVDIADLILNNNICCLDIDTYCNFINENLKNYLNNREYKEYHATVIAKEYIKKIDTVKIENNGLFDIIADDVNINDYECSYLCTSDMIEIFDTIQSAKNTKNFNEFIKKVVTIARLIKHIIFIYSM